MKRLNQNAILMLNAINVQAPVQEATDQRKQRDGGCKSNEDRRRNEDLTATIKKSTEGKKHPLANSTATISTAIVTTDDAPEPWSASHLVTKIKLMQMELRKDINLKLRELRSIETDLDQMFNTFFPEQSLFDFSILLPLNKSNKLTPIE